jgi:ankyrin repeat protein
MAMPSDNENAEPGNLQARVMALFDDEVAWDADDTDAFLLHAIDELAQTGADVASLTDGGGNSLLHVAALWNRPAIMEALVRCGAELNATNTVCSLTSCA